MCTPTVLHTLLAAAFHWLLHILHKRGAVVTFEGEAPASDSKGGAAGGNGGARPGGHLAPAPTLHPGEGLGRLAEDSATLQSVVISYRLTSTRGLCGRKDDQVSEFRGHRHYKHIYFTYLLPYCDYPIRQTKYLPTMDSKFETNWITTV